MYSGVDAFWMVVGQGRRRRQGVQNACFGLKYLKGRPLLACDAAPHMRTILVCEFYHAVCFACRCVGT